MTATNPESNQGEAQETAAPQTPADKSKFMVAVFADFVCPYSYITIDQMDRLNKEYGVRVLWRPHWLHPEIPPEGKPFDALPGSADRRAAVMTWVKEMSPEHADQIRFPDKVQYSFLAFEALEFAVDQGKSMPFKSAVFKQLWNEGKDIAQVETLQIAAEQSGLDAESLGNALRQHRYAPRALAAVEQARSLNVTATPTMFLGRTRVNGWHYYEVIQTILEKQGILPIESPAVSTVISPQ
jgi:predicted DsbA family dithiol-disulfide isomerase